MDLGLAGKKALVTGGSRGIGRAVVERLVAEGMRVAICARNAAGVELAAKELGPNGEVVGAAVDASDHPVLAAWVEESARGLGGVDVIVSNASALGGIPHSPEGWRRNVVAFLASPMASWVSGQNLVVDGSFTLRIGY